MPTLFPPTQFSGATVLVAAINETFSLSQTLQTIRDTCAPTDIREILLLLSRTKSTGECVKTAELLVRDQLPFPVSIMWQTLPFAGGAYRDGFDAAQGSHVIMMSADLETDPALVCQMIAVAKKNPDAVVTMSRWIKGGEFAGYNRIKQVCNYLFQKMFACLYATRLTDLTYAYRCFPAALMRQIAWREVRHPLFLETALVPLRFGIRFLELPARWAPRQEAASQNSFFANFSYFKTALRVRFATRQSLLNTQSTKPTDSK